MSSHGPENNVCYKKLDLGVTRHGTNSSGIQVFRVRHGYGKTRGFSKTGSVGMGMVVDFGTPWHTAYPYHGIVGMYG